MYLVHKRRNACVEGTPAPTCAASLIIALASRLSTSGVHVRAGSSVPTARKRLQRNTTRGLAWRINYLTNLAQRRQISHSRVNHFIIISLISLLCLSVYVLCTTHVSLLWSEIRQANDGGDLLLVAADNLDSQRHLITELNRRRGP